MKQTKLNDYMKNNQFGIDIIAKKYLKKDETIYDSFERMAKNLIEFETDKSYYDKWIETLWKGLWRPGGSIWSSIGDDEYPKQSTANCTGLVCQDDSLEGIIRDVGYFLAKCAAYRQGVGITFSKLRPNGTKINNSARISSGSIHWMKFWANLATYVGQCLTGDTLIKTDRGNVPIKTIVEHPEIEYKAFTHKGYKKIVNRFNNGEKPIYKIKLKSGKTIKTTINHKIMTIDGLKPLYDINENDEIKTLNNKLTINEQLNTTDIFIIDKIEKINNIGFDTTYNIEVENAHLYFANDIYVSNSGRIPAILFALSISHPDIIDFITCKDDLNVVNNANLSIHITEKFMQAVKNNDDWNLEFEGKIFKTLKAKELFKIISEHAWKHGEPGLQFIDEMNKYSMQKYCGFEIETSNACCLPEYVEIFTENGIITIGELYKQNAKNFKVKIENNKWTNIQEIIKQVDYKDVWKLTTENGKKLHATYDHKIKVQNGNLIELYKLHIGNEIVTIDGIEKINSIINLNRKMEVYDLINSDTHTFSANGIIVSNSEKPLPNFSVCNLASINVGELTIGNYKNQLKELVPIITRFLDDVVSYELKYNKSPIPQQKEIVSKLREIGVGVTNVHQFLFDNNIGYDSDEGIEIIEDIMKHIALYTFEESVKIASEKGEAPGFNEGIYNSPYYQLLLKELGLKNPKLRNLSHVSIAPSGSISNTFPKQTLSSGIEPALGFAYWRKTRVSGKYEWYFVLTESAKKHILNKINNNQDKIFIENFPESVKDETFEIGKKVFEIIKNTNSTDILKGAMDVNPFKKIELISKVQKWVDAGISTTFNLPKNYSIEDVEKIYMSAYKNKLKAITVYRLGSREDIITIEVPDKNDNIKKIKRPEKIELTYSPKRPKILPCDIHKTVVKGEKWVVLIGLLENRPYEVFAGKYENIEIPTTANKGEIIKVKSGHYNLHIKTDRLDVTIEKLSNVLTNNNPERNALTRALSTQLRHGVPVTFIIDQLNKSEGSVVDFSKAVARVLKKYKEFEDKNGITKCPLCGSPVQNLTGCPTCINPKCGWSKCS